MKINVYLLKNTTKSYEECLSNKIKSLKELDIIDIGDIRNNMKAFSAVSINSPKWKASLSKIVEISDDIKNINNSILLLVKVKNRFFAITFGYANSFINPNLIEPLFGIKVVANSVSPNDINEVIAKKTDKNTMQQITHSTRGTNLQEFGINTFMDWISSLSGKPCDISNTNKLVGGKSLILQYKHDLKNLPNLCENLLDLFYSNKYKKDFSFIDHFTIISNRVEIYKELEKKLYDALENEYSNIVIAYPQIFDEAIYSNFKIGIRNTKAEYVSNRVSLSEIRNCFPGKVKNVYIKLIDSNGNQVYDEFSIFDFILYEVKEGDKTYVYSSKLWFETNSVHEKEINKQFEQIDDISGILQMPDWKNGEKEGEYNNRVSNMKNWCLLDKKNFREGLDQIEICDLLTENKYFICVKKMKDSARLSHLFSQGSVSAKLYKNNYQGYQQVVNEKAKKFWNDNRFEQSKEIPCIVYAIQTKKVGNIKDNIFLFSKINLINNANIIKGFGYKVGICQININ